MNIVVKARHMDATDALRRYAESKVAKLPRFYDSIQSVQVILDVEADQPTVEILATARRRNTFVATHRDEDMRACIDQCLDKIIEQIRRHKDKVRHRQGQPHSVTLQKAQQQAEAAGKPPGRSGKGPANPLH